MRFENLKNQTCETPILFEKMGAGIPKDRSNTFLKILNMGPIPVKKNEVKFDDENQILSFIYNSISKILNKEAPANSMEVSINQNRSVEYFENNSFSQEELFDKNNYALKEVIPILRFIGQVKNTFLVCEGPDAIYLIDQHAAHERILYEKYFNSPFISNRTRSKIS